MIWYDAFPVNKIRNYIVKQISNNLIKNEIDIIITRTKTSIDTQLEG